MSEAVPRYRRSPYLLLKWEENDVVLVQCDAQRRFRVDQRLVALLSTLDGWTTVEELPAATTANEAELERLVSMGIVERANGALPDAASDSYWNPFDLAVHRSTNTGGYRAADVEARGRPAPPASKPRPDGPVTRLPEPAPLPAISFPDVLTGRRSLRRYDARDLTLAELSMLLHHSARVIREMHDVVLGDQSQRPFASGGGRSELELYVVSNAVEGLPPGAHYYDPRAHELITIRPRDDHQEALLTWIHSTSDGALNRDPAVVILVTAVFERIMWKYDGIGLGLIYKNTGSLFQTLYLVATALGLAPCAIGGGEERANSVWLGLDPLTESQVGCFLVGPREPVETPRARPSAPVLDPERIMRLSQGFMGSAILRSGLDLGVFDRLGTGSEGVEGIAASIDADARGTGILLDALVAANLLGREGDEYSLTPLAAGFLVRGHADFIGDQAQAYSHDTIWRAMARLPDAVRMGGGVLDEQEAKAYWVDLARGLETPSQVASAHLAEIVAPWASDRAHLDVLDVACGNGAYGHALAERYPVARLWSLEWPDVLRVARERAEARGLLDRTQHLSGDMFTMALGGPYDAVVLSHVLHHFAEERCVELLTRISQVLAPDGRLMIQEFVTGASDPGGELAPYLFSLIMLATTREGQAHSLSAYGRMLASAGFEEPAVHAVPELPTRFLIAAPRSR